MRTDRVLRATLAVLALAGGASTASAEPPAPDAPAAAATRVETWNGYLYRGEGGRLCVGIPVVAMGVMAVPPSEVEGPLAATLAPYVSTAKDAWFFLNYTLEEEGGEARVPSVLVKLRGRVAGGEEPYAFSGQGTARTMREGRLVTIERLDPAWLRSWALVFRDPASPWRVAEKQDASPVAVRAFAVRLLDAWRAMRGAPGIDAAWRATVRTLDAAAVPVETMRRAKEREIQRWLVEEDARRGWKLPGLVDLPPLPPTAAQVQALLLASETRAAFLAAIAKAWSEIDLEDVVVPYYETWKGAQGESTSAATASAADVRDVWTDAAYGTRRATTREIVGR